MKMTVTFLETVPIHLNWLDFYVWSQSFKGSIMKTVHFHVYGKRTSANLGKEIISLIGPEL